MKKFFLCTGVFLFFFLIYWRLLASEELITPSRLAFIVAIGLLAVTAFIGVLNSAPRAWKEWVFCCRRRQLRRKITEKERVRKLGTTTVVLN